MTKNRVHGNNYGVMVGSATGEVNVRGSKVDVSGTAADDGGTSNEVYGDNHGVMLGTVNGDINIFSHPH